MTKFAEISAALEKLPEARREEIAAILETLFHGDLHPETHLSDAQLVDLAGRLADPGPLATDAEVDAFFSRFRA